MKTFFVICLCAASLARGADGTVTFNEIHYHGSANDDAEEFIELHSLMTVDMDLSGWFISGGVDFSFPAGALIHGGGNLVVAGAPAALAAATGLTNILGPFTGRLANGGERLLLRNNNGRIIDEVTYGDGDDWPAAADGAGASLVKYDPTAPSDRPASWRASPQVGGSPGQNNFRGPDASLISLLPTDTSARMFIPTDASLQRDWTAPDFDDLSWMPATTSIGYEAETNDLSGLEVMADEPAGWWRLDETDGTVALDSSGHGRDGTYNGGVMLGAESGGPEGDRAARFDGSTGYVQLPGTWGGGPEATVEAWVSTEAPVTGDFQSIIATPDGGFTHFQLHTVGNAGAYTSAGFVALPIPPPTPTGRWRHIVMTISSGDSRIYVDGVQLGGTVTTVFNTISPATYLAGGTRGVRIGNGHQGGRWFKGRLDEVAIYDTALSPERVRAHYLARGLHGAAFRTDLREAMYGKGSSAYLRIPFLVTDADLVDALRLRVNYNDAFVAYLNGIEVAARNAPSMPAFNSMAITNRPRAALEEEISLTSVAGLLREGYNLLAVHGLTAANATDFLLMPELFMHEGDRSYDLVLNEVSGADDPAPGVELLNRGASPIETGGYVLTDASGSPTPYVLPDRTLAPGEFLVIPTAQFTEDLQAGDVLVLSAPGGHAVVDSLKVRAQARARVPDGRGDWYFVEAATLGAPNAVSRHDEVVINELMYHHLPAFETPAGYEERAVLPMEATWRYNQSGINFGSDWPAPGFDDQQWLEGAALFYSTSAALPAAKNTPLTLGRRTYYFRTQFVFDGGVPGAAFTLNPIVDDGAVFYLNGVEVLRVNMPGGSVSYATYASTSVGIASQTGPYLLDPSNLVVGANTLAVEVHQASVSGNDIVFGVELRQRVLVTPGAPFQESDQQWIELYNRGPSDADLTGWRLDQAVKFDFPFGTHLPAGGYLVVAKDVEGLRALHPDANVLGPFDKQFSHHGEEIVLRDASGNPADLVHYFDGGRWPDGPDGGGPSLELRDPRADNSVAEAWAASDESGRSVWQTYSYRGPAAPSLGPDNQWREFVLGLLDGGEVLLDDISVVEDPDGAGAQLLQNTSFENGLSGWRVIGNHHGQVVTDPDNPGNHCLHLVARGATGHWSNHAETTLANNRAVVNGRVYEISFRAKWLSGCPRLNTRLYFNRLPRTTRLAVPTEFGTPGGPNSRVSSNIGPTFRNLRHSPAVPAPGQDVTVTVQADDPDGVTGVTLWWSGEGGSWTNAAMVKQNAAEAPDTYAFAIPGAPAGTLVQFYVSAADSQGAAAMIPAAGPDSRALYRVNDGQADFSRGHNVRILMTAPDTELLHFNGKLLSNDPLGCTMVYDENEVFYDAGVHLRGTSYSRPYGELVSFSVDFAPEHLFRGVLGSIDLDRSGRGPVGSPGQDEILIRHLITHGGGLPGDYADLVRIITPRPEQNSSAMLYLGHYTGDYLDSAYDQGSDSMLFKFDGAYYPTRTIDGDPESPKLVEASPISYTDIRDLGDDPEGYRWNFLARNNRVRDDYSRLILLAKAFDLNGAALDSATQSMMDVSEWLRLFAVLSLTGIADVYTQGNPHNMWLYVRPDDQRFLAFPHDLDVSFSRSTSAPLTGDNGNMLKIINLPANRRLFYWHLRDLITSTWNQNYMAYWTDHYDNFLPGQDFSGILDYIDRRASYVLSQLPGNVPFSILTEAGQDFVTDQAETVLRGSAPVDVRQIWSNTGPLDLSWVNATNWQVSLPLKPGANVLTFTALDQQKQLFATTDITIVSTSNQEETDTDGDGMPDAWEVEHGLSPTVPDAEADKDGDGLSNYAEYVAGTDPSDPSSVLSLDVTGAEPGTVTFRFAARVGRTYSLLRSPTLPASQWSVWTNFPAQLTEEITEVIVPTAPGQGAGGFYRLITPQQP